jgi:voltage-gated potassium channel
MLKFRKKASHSRVLYTKAPVSAERVLVNRALLLLVLLGIVIVTLWLDRAGLRDHIDGHISFSDVVYFAMITITTVGYGDIVPVSDRARLIDVLLVTPVRIFVWLIFLGTAYQLVFQRIWEDIRMSMLRNRLSDHVVICGYGQSGTVAAREVAAAGTPRDRIVVIDISEECVQAAAEAGYVGLRGDPTQERILRDAGIEGARAAIVSLGRDDTTVLCVLTIRNLNPAVRIVATVWEDENAKLVHQAGASTTVMPSQVNGYLLADSIVQSHTAEYVLDLLSSDGRVRICERPAGPGDIGKPMRAIESSLVVRLYRDGQPIGFWETDRNTVRAGDTLIVIERTAG